MIDDAMSYRRVSSSGAECQVWAAIVGQCQVKSLCPAEVASSSMGCLNAARFRTTCMQCVTIHDIAEDTAM